MQIKKFYAAHLSKDPRFDGKFFVAVKTTGIYCRPICPARKAKLKNLTFYLNAEQAEENGYRPCLRCRPETAPGSAAWLGTSATVQRALRLMDVSATENLSIVGLADKLGIGERWLRQLFQDQIGVSPQTILLNKKLTTARRLLDESSLSITEIAYSSGFQSLRRFNDAFKNCFKRAPRELRKSKLKDSGNRIQLNYRPPFAWNGLLSFFEYRAISGVEFVDETSYSRSIQLFGAKGWLTITKSAENKLAVDFSFDKNANLVEFVSRVRNMFDLDADPQVIKQTLYKDKKLKSMYQKFNGTRIPGGWDGFEIAVRAIIGQQISVKAAVTILGRLVESCGEKYVGPNSNIKYYFPTPKQVAKSSLMGLGLTRSRIATLKTLAHEVCEGNICLNGTEEYQLTCDKLLALKGIGPWTVDYISMRSLRNPNAFPETDLELKKQVSKYNLDPGLWDPWRSYAAIVLWKHSAEI